MGKYEKNMKLKDLKKHTIVCIGLGAEIAGLIDYLYAKKLNKKIVVLDNKNKTDLLSRYPKFKKYKNIVFQKDTRSFNELKKFSLIFKSPGAHIDLALRKKLSHEGSLIISPMQLFLELSPSKNIIGVTGTKGKGTTSALIAEILKKAKKKVWLGGNIGIAPFDFIKKIKKSDWLVLELSSFQLEDMNAQLPISVLTNFSPEHLKPADPNNPNHHPSLKHYWQAKLQIVKTKNKNHLFIVNEKLKDDIKKENLQAKIIYFKTSNLATRLPGEHNKENIAAAVTVAKSLKIKDKIIAKAVKNFKGLEHRLEKVTIKKGVEYYNDSFSTIPESTITAIKAFNKPIILLAGGADKGSDFSGLAKIVKQKVKALILFKGLATPRLKREIIKSGFNPKNIFEVDNMKKAVTQSQRQAKSGDIVLMSPAAASFGIFKNYKDRGKQFKQSVLLL